MIDEWPPARFAAEVAARERIALLFDADWCPFSAAFRPIVERAEPEANVPFARANLRHPMDPRWDAYRILTIPTLIYFEHGEELERCEAIRGRGLSPRDLDDFLHTIDSIQEEPRLPKRMHGPRRS